MTDKKAANAKSDELQPSNSIIISEKDKWIRTPSNIRADRSMGTDETVAVFACNANGRKCERVVFKPSATQADYAAWPKHFADFINRNGQSIRAGSRIEEDGFVTEYEPTLNYFWIPTGSALTIISTSCHLDNWTEKGNINAVGSLLSDTTLELRVTNAVGYSIEVLQFHPTAEELDRYVWPSRFSQYINNQSSLIRAGEKKTDTHFITPVGSAYLNKLWAPEHAVYSVSVTCKISAVHCLDADLISTNLSKKYFVAPPSAQVIDGWLSNFEAGRFTDLQYPPTSGFVDSSVLGIHIDRIKAIADYATQHSADCPAHYLSAAVHAINFYAIQDFKAQNWWDWAIGLAKKVSVAAVLLAPHVKGQLTEFFLPYIMRTTNTDANQTGANLADYAYIQLLWSVAGWTSSLQRDFLIYLKAASNTLASLCFPVARHGKENSEGISVDYSFSQHCPEAGKYSQLYSGSYGVELIGRIADGHSVLVGEFKFDKTALQALERHLC